MLIFCTEGQVRGTEGRVVESRGVRGGEMGGGGGVTESSDKLPHLTIRTLKRTLDISILGNVRCQNVLVCACGVPGV